MVNTWFGARWSVVSIFISTFPLKDWSRAAVAVSRVPVIVSGKPGELDSSEQNVPFWHSIEDLTSQSVVLCFLFT